MASGFKIVVDFLLNWIYNINIFFKGLIYGKERFSLNGGIFMEYRYKTQGVCSTEMIFDIDENTNTVNDLKVINGCNGNLKGISSLVKGMKIDDVISKLDGITCGFRSTSCPDQISRALKEYSKNRNEE